VNDETYGADLNERATFAEAPRRRRRWLLPAVAVLVAAAVGIGGWWYAATPHSAAEQLEAAAAAKADYLGRAGQLAADEAAAEREKVVEAYRRVFTAFEATDEQAATAHEQLAQLHDHAGDTAAARRWWTQLIDRYGETAQARDAYEALIDSYLAEAKSLLAADPDAAGERLDQAVDVCRGFVDRYGTDDPDAPAVAMRRCRILDDLIGEPAEAIQAALEDFVATYGDSDLVDEALWRLGRLHERIAEPRAAAAYYERLINDYPDSPWLKQAEIGRARAVSEFDSERGEALWRELAAKYADDPEIEHEARREAERLEAQQQAEADREQAETAQRDARDYRRRRYGGGGGAGGGGPVDSGWGKPIPPSEMLRDFIDQKVDAEHYRLELTVDPDAHALEITGSVVLVNGGQAKEDFLLMLGPLFEPGAFALDGRPVEVVRPSGKAEVIQVRLDEPWAAGARATLTFAYTATVEPLEWPETLDEQLLDQLSARRPAGLLVASPVPSAPQGRPDSAGGVSPRCQGFFRAEPRRGDLMLPGASAPRAIASGCRMGKLKPPRPSRAHGRTGARLWAAQVSDDGDETPPAPETIAGLLRNPGLQLQINDSGYALSGAAWYPVTIFGDLFTAEIAVTLPEDLTVLCSGAAAGERTADGRRTTTWRCEEPYFGLYFAYGPYESASRDVDGLTISVHFLAQRRAEQRAEQQADQAARMEAYLDVAEAILTEYIAHFGPFPFEKLAMAEVKLPPILGGVGPASLTFLHHGVVAGREAVPVNLLAHELSHQWWGNQVPINLIDERYSQWLSEGFATYSDALYTEWSEGAGPFREHIRELGGLYLEQSAHVREEAIVETFMGQSPLYRPVVYEKGALVLHALRYVLGDETFFEVLREYVRTYAFTPSTVDDFRRLAAERAGENLDWFFDEWLDRPGCPHIELADVTVEPGDGEGVWTVVVSLAQPAHLSRMPIDVVVLGDDGRARRVRTALDRKAHTVKIEVAFPVKRVVLDPDDWVLRRTAPDEWPPDEAAR